MMKISKWKMALIALAAVVVAVPLLMAQQNDEGRQDSGSGADWAQSQAQQRAQRRAAANNTQGQFQIGEEEEEEENRRRR